MLDLLGPVNTAGAIAVVSIAILLILGMRIIKLRKKIRRHQGSPRRRQWKVKAAFLTLTAISITIGAEASIVMLIGTLGPKSASAKSHAQRHNNQAPKRMVTKQNNSSLDNTINTYFPRPAPTQEIKPRPLPETLRRTAPDDLQPSTDQNAGGLVITLPYPSDQYYAVYAEQVDEGTWIVHTFPKNTPASLDLSKLDLDMVKGRIDRIEADLAGEPYMDNFLSTLPATAWVRQ